MALVICTANYVSKWATRRENTSFLINDMRFCDVKTLLSWLKGCLQPNLDEGYGYLQMCSHFNNVLLCRQLQIISEKSQTISPQAKFPIAHQWQHSQHCYSADPVCSQSLSQGMALLYPVQEPEWQIHPPPQHCNAPVHTVLSPPLQWTRKR